MKIEWTKETTTRVASNIAILFAGIVFFFIVWNIEKIWQGFGWITGIIAPFIFGIVIAFLLTGPTRFFEKFLKKRVFRKCSRHGIVRAVAVGMTFAATALVLALIINAIIPQLVQSVMSLVDSMPAYLASFNKFVEEMMLKFNIDDSIFKEFVLSWRDIVGRVTEFLGGALPKVFNVSKQITSGVTNFLFGFIISIYLLSGKERFIAQIKKALFAIFPTKFVTATVRISRHTCKTFSRYLSGQLLDSAILGVICFICMSIFRMEYALLISFIIMITNLIPFFGPIIGAIPGSFILLMISPMKALWFIVLIIVLQQLDGNVLAPRIVGKTTGLPAFWVVFAIFVGGGLFGFIGIIVAVPAFSIIYVILRNVFEKRLEKKGLPVATGSYNDSDFPL
ncbi:MAG: AI-2E family transporter [Clostridia bacterium]